LHEAFIEAVSRPGIGSLPENFPVRELAGRAPAGVSAAVGVQYATPGGGRITVPWDRIPPSALADLYEHVLPADAPERKDIDAYREATK